MDHKEVTFFKGIESLEKSHFAIIKNNFTSQPNVCVATMKVGASDPKGFSQNKGSLILKPGRQALGGKT